MKDLLHHDEIHIHAYTQCVCVYACTHTHTNRHTYTHTPTCIHTGMKDLLHHDEIVLLAGTLLRAPNCNISSHLQDLLKLCVEKCENILNCALETDHAPPQDNLTCFERKMRTATVAPNREAVRAYPNFSADLQLAQECRNHCSKYPTPAHNLMPGMFMVVCVGCGKIELVQLMPSYESPLTAYKVMYLRDWRTAKQTA